MKTVFVLVDALKSLYLTEENMPFLYKLAKSNYLVKEIVPCAGFCERSEIFSGLDGYDTGNFTAIGYLPELSPYKNDRFIISIASFFSKIHPTFTKRLFQKWRRKKGRILNPYRIPYRSLNNFALTEDGIKQLIPHKTIFDRLKENNLSYSLDAFTALSDLVPRLSESLYDFLGKEISKETFFIPLYVGSIDFAGHRYGRNIQEIKPYLLEVDNLLSKFYSAASKNGYNFCVLGDHGMVPVEKKIDIMAGIESLGMVLGKDYESFYDSTTVRLWFYSKTSEAKIIEYVDNNYSDCGFWVRKENSEHFRIPLDLLSQYGKPVYGDIIWCAHPGVLISPDYFHPRSSAENGMHGYVECVSGEGTGLFVSTSKKGEVAQKTSSQICGELCDCLGIIEPNINWKRINRNDRI